MAGSTPTAGTQYSRGGPVLPWPARPAASGEGAAALLLLLLLDVPAAPAGEAGKTQGPS